MGGTKPGPTWTTYRSSIGDRSPLFAEVASQWGIERALYPGCYLDLAPSVVIDAVTYVDLDRRAARYFSEPALAASELQEQGRGRDHAPEIEFLQLDYTRPLPLDPGSFDLLISLYAGPVWEHCRRHLAPGGLLLANASHGDASLAALEPDLRLVAAVHQHDGTYSLDLTDLDSYLVPRSARPPDAEQIRRSGKGITYTRPAFAYVFLTPHQSPWSKG